MTATFTPRLPAGSIAGHAVLALPIVLWMVAVAVINPLGNFPLNDDWSFALAVRHLLATGEFRPLGWTSMTLVGHVFWGALFCLPSGFSFNALRIATLVAGALGLIAFCALLQALGCDRRKTAFAMVLFGFNPIYLNLANTFMTDVGFATLSLFSTLFFWRYLVARQPGRLLWAMVFAIAALSVRQLALFLPIAMLAAFIVERKKDWRAIALALATLLVSMALLYAFDAWLNARHATPALYGKPSEVLFRQLASPITFVIGVLQNVRRALAYLGWFLFPVLMWRLPAIVREYASVTLGKSLLMVAAIIALAWFVAMVAFHHFMPVATNIVQASGLGPVLMHDADNGNLAALPAAFWISITFLAAVGGILLLLDVGLTIRTIVANFRARQIDAATSLRVFVLIGVCAYLGPIMAISYYDRYLMPPTFLLIALIMLEGRAEATSAPQRRWSAQSINFISTLTLLYMCAFSVAGTHDYMNWNRARWQLLQQLAAEGVAPERIDGGFEFNGLHMYDPAYVVSASKSFWWVHDDEYIVQFKPRDGYRIVASADAEGWLPPFRRELLVLKRDGS
ncbi:hypothetical protein VOM14_01880 [Paraburkholderia sp. MPAMCS5]|uniref:hypothetical protein n=1 Tax=Paraburkholderia sp. MPAMCS5 TaxID=3112563 RepID=UPI002E1945C9|nr:hypothetical protein [Paraburkholderia sp. MPAMCS5]